MKKFLSYLALPAALLALSSRPALACAACYGDTSGSQQGIAASWGVFAMVIIMFCMLSAVAGFRLLSQLARQNPLPDYEELLGNNDAQPNPGTSL